MNTASFSHADPKKIVAPPAVINSLAKHVFNDIIWPNLSDENNGVGLLTYHRLEPESEYVEVANGISAQVRLVSHGHCMKTMHVHASRNNSSAGISVSPASPAAVQQPAFASSPCVMDSSVYFLRCDVTGKEIMMWGDVEPDSVSIDIRNHYAWREAAKKFVAGKLTAIFIECSYDDDQPKAMLFGHLAPTYLLEELWEMAKNVIAMRKEMERERRDRLKRKRMSNPDLSAMHPANHPHPPRRGSVGTAVRTPPPEEPDSSLPLSTDDNGEHHPLSFQDYNLYHQDHPDNPTESEYTTTSFPSATVSNNVTSSTLTHSCVGLSNNMEELPLEGLLVVITHVKDPLTDGVDVKARILEDLEKGQEKAGRLGCRFKCAERGGDWYV